MDGDLYDEFGNYIGPDLESDSEDEQSVYGQDNRDADEDAMEEDEDADVEPEAAPMSVVLHEDKRYDDSLFTLTVIINIICTLTSACYQ